MADKYSAAAEQEIDGGSEFSEEELDAQIQDGLDADPEAGGEGELEDEELEGLEEPEEEQPPAAAEKRSGKGPMVPLKGLQAERRKRQGLEGENQALRIKYDRLLSTYNEVTGKLFPGGNPGVAPQGKTAEQHDPLAGLDPDMPISVQEVRSLLDQTIKATEERIFAAFEERNRQSYKEANIRNADLEGVQTHGKEGWTEIKAMMEEVAEAYPEYIDALVAAGTKKPLAQVVEDLAKLHPQYEERLKTKVAENVVGNIKRQLEKPKPAISAKGQNMSDSFSKFAARYTKGIQDRDTEALLDQSLADDFK